MPKISFLTRPFSSFRIKLGACEKMNLKMGFTNTQPNLLPRMGLIWCAPSPFISNVDTGLEIQARYASCRAGSLCCYSSLVLWLFFITRSVLYLFKWIWKLCMIMPSHNNNFSCLLFYPLKLAWIWNHSFWLMNLLGYHIQLLYLLKFLFHYLVSLRLVLCA